MPDFRATAREAIHALWHSPDTALDAAAAAGLSADTSWCVSAPVEALDGRAAVLDGFVRPLRAALSHTRRRDLILIGGRNTRAPGGAWVASVCHYVGSHDAPLFGVAPSGHLAFLRAGEFYRLDDDGRIAEARVIVDLVDLMRQAGRLPLPRQLGTEMTFPAPATQDGLLPQAGDGAAALAVVERMLAALQDFDPDTFASSDQTGPGGTWADDMLWYGPGGIGASYRWAGFVADHRAAFLTAFPDRAGGNHFCRIGDGDYVALSGWPSMTMTHAGAYLGQPATHRALSLRVMDFYRVAAGRIAENWVLLDYVDLFAQMGRDLIAESRALPGRAP